MQRRQRITTAGLVVKEGNRPGLETCEVVREWLEARGIRCSVTLHPGQHIGDTLLPGTDLLIVFAGDGTMVSIARQSLGMNIPISGINFGQVGFLAELSRETWREALERALRDGIMVDDRMTLRYRLFRNARCLLEGEVVNDVVVTRGKVARLVSLQLGVNKAPFTTLRSDGLILSTPTGASGYAGSAGGPLLLPSLNVYVVAAICPYLSSFPPLVLDQETIFSVTVGEAAPDLYLTLDGQEAHPLAESDRLEVQGVPGRMLVADFGHLDYFARLLHAGFVRGSMRP